MCLNFACVIFIVGLVGIVLTKKTFLTMLLCIELTLFAVSLNFIFFSLFTYNVLGQILALLIITVAAADSAIGLSLLIVAYRLGVEVSYDSLIILRG